MPGRPTMKEISQIAGVSQSTVSRILSGTEFRVPIAPRTRERVLKAVADLGYTPNPLARALRGARSALLGLIVRDVADPFFALAIEAITAEARRRGNWVVLGHARARAKDAATFRETLATWHGDGTILLGDLRDDPSLLAHLLGRELPLVGLCQGSRAPRIPVVNVDNAVGTRMAREHHLAVPSGYVRDSDNNLAGGLDAGLALLALSRPPTAIFAASDVVALGVLKAAASRGVKVPDELSVVGFDDIPFAAYAVPSLTTVRQPIDDMARLAVDQVLELL